MPKAKVMIVDGAARRRGHLAKRLSAMGYQGCAHAASGQEALSRAGDCQAGIILVDADLGGSPDGIETAVFFREAHSLPVVFITSSADDDFLERAKAAGPFGYLLRPFSDGELRAALEMGLHQASAERRLRESERRLRYVIDGVADGIWALDEFGVTTFCNTRLQEILGRGRDELAKRKLDELFDADNAKLFSDNLLLCRQGQSEPFEISLTTPDGRLTHAVFSPRAMRDRLGRHRGCLVAVTDITAMKQTQLSLRWQAQVNAALARIADVLLHSEATFGQITEVILANARQLTQSEFGYVASIDPVSHELVNHTISEMMGKQCSVSGDGRRIVFPRRPDGFYPGLWGHSLNTAKAFFCEDPRAHPSSAGLPPGHAPLQRFLSAPAMIDDRLVGQIAVANASRPYTQGDLDAVARIAELFALALQRQEALDALRNSETKYRLLADNSTDTIWTADLNLRVNYISPAVRELLGYTPEEAMRLPHASLITPPSLELMKRMLAAGLEREAGQPGSSPPRTIEMEHRRKDGRDIIVEVSARFLRDDAGRPVGLLGSSRDVTQRRKTQDDLAESEGRYRELFDSIGDFVYTHDENGVMLSANKALATAVGLPREEIIGRCIADLTLPHLRQAFFDGYLEPLKRTGEHEGLFVVNSASGQGRYVEYYTSKGVDRQGRVFFRGSAHDVTERRQLARELRRAKDEAEAASRAKSDFLANMSHEIRTPMNAIIGMTNLTLMTNLSREQQEFLTTVKRSAESLMQLLNDILDISKIEARQLALEEKDFDLIELLESTLRAMAVRAHAKGLELALRVAPDVPGQLRADPLRLRQILLNLLGNAIKFTIHGQVLVEARRSADADDELMFSVIDSGVGIEPEMLPRIFDRFTQADSSSTRRFGGAGLGAAICRELCQLMGGRIWVQSTAGQGSAFHFTIRAGRPPQEAPPQPKDLAGLSLLLVEANQTVRHSLLEMLQQRGAVVVGAASGPEGLDRLIRSGAAGGQFDAAIIDMGLPGPGGAALAQAIRAQARWASLPILFMTAAGRPDSLQPPTMTHGASVAKPVSRGEMARTLLELASGTAPPTKAMELAAAVQSPIQELHILLAEDNDLNQKLAVALLTKRGHQVVVTENGRQAVEAFGREPFDLVLMDVQMPEMDGLEATRAIRAMEKHDGGRTPIVAMTAHAMESDRQACLEAGMDTYVSKPIQHDEFLATIETMAAGRRYTPRPPAKPDASAAVLDRDEFLSRVAGDEALVRQLAAIFLEDLDQRVQAINAALAVGDPAALTMAAHTLKGEAGNISAHGLHKAALALERAARAADLAQARQLAAAVLAEIDRLRLVVKDLADN